MQSHYQFNVAKRGKFGKLQHLFATAPHSATMLLDAEQIAKELQEKFPAPMYEVTCTRWDALGTRAEF